MKETLLEKVNYLLSYKLNIENTKYKLLIENLFFEFLVALEKHYLDEGVSSTTFYNILLNRLNKNIKSIIIPAQDFCYHPSGFLEFRVNLKDELLPYEEENIVITPEVKEEVLRKKYYFYMLRALKNNPSGIGFFQNDDRRWLSFEKSLNEYQAMRLANMQKIYKKEYKTMYPDGTSYHYFLYTRDPGASCVLNLNAVAMVENLFGEALLFQKDMEGGTDILIEFDEKYQHLLGDLQYDKFGHSVYTVTTIMNEFFKRIRKDQSVYKKLEYFKKMNQFLLEIFDYKVTTILNQKNDEKIKKLYEDLKVFESSVLYNANYELNSSMEHIKKLKLIKTKLQNYQRQGKEKVEKEYVIYSMDKKRKETVTSSVQPIQVDNKYVLIHILELRSMNSRLLIKADFHVVDLGGLATRIYSGIYLSVKEMKHLYSSADLGVVTRESEVIRSSIANRLINPTIMDIIKTERNHFLGEFIYSKVEDRAIIYKNKSIEEALQKGI